MFTTDIIQSIKNKVLKTKPEKTNYIGFSAGLTYGLGFTYKKIIDNKGVQVSVLPFRMDNSTATDTYKNSIYAGGVTLFNIIDKGTYGNLFISGGAGALKRQNTYTTYRIVPGSENQIDPNDPTKQQTEKEVVTDNYQGVAAGPAIGMEINFAENFTISISLPMAFVFGSLKPNESLKFTSILPIPNISLFYRF